MSEIRLIAAQGADRGSFGRQYGYSEDNREKNLKVLARRQLLERPVQLHWYDG
jgi:hypothetical protein